MADAAELVRDHVQRFNRGVRTGDFGPMLERFAPGAELVFEGVPAASFGGREAIARAYREQPPGDEIDVTGIAERDGEIVAGYAWKGEGGRRAGDMRITERDGLIQRLVVTFEGAAGA